MKPVEVNEHTSITYLKSEELSKVLADGFALLYHNKPQFPVTYLANYLLNHSKTTKNQHQLQQVINQKRKIIDGFRHKQQEQKVADQKQAVKSTELKSNMDRFDRYIKEHPTHGYVLSDVCEQLEKRFQVAGVYLGEIKNPKRAIQENDDGENAHLEMEQPKRIEYIAYSKSQKPIMEGKHLSLESVTGALFTDKPADAGDGEPAGDDQEKKPKEKNYLYVPEVVKNDKMVYFRLPKLGAYMAVPVICKSYLGESLFESGLEQTLKHQKAVEQLEKQHEKKQNEFREQYDEKQRSGTDQKELDEMERKYEEEKAAVTDVPKPILPSNQRQYVVCFDTLGLEREIPEQIQEQIASYVEFLKKSWEDKEQSYLQSDIDNQIKYMQTFEGPIADQLPKFNEQEEKEMAQEMDELSKYKSNEKQYNFETDSLRLEKIKEQFTEDKYQQYFQTLRSMNILRYPGIMQAALYFLGYTKQQINLPGTNILDWKEVRQLIVKDKFIDQLCEYTHRGLREAQIQPYARWNRLLPQLQKYDLNAVLIYNLFYGKLLKYLLMTGKLRKIDCQLRAQKLEQQKKARLQRIAQNDKIEAEKQRIREQQRTLAKEKQDHVFDQEAWQLQYSEQHPLQEVGDEIQPEIDRDFDQEEQQPPSA